ncbi:hypothetical protein N0V83_002372 [Neocucurbitaria cava]|uniref:Uncharacterized protein n=1 Tax=Neocucurbitaria cava TaxID=798079 RepID=A0A9W8YEK6_9PLEO|nr:hypothetical protein N0V83_002372 [Neocucurbitaria cava]
MSDTEQKTPNKTGASGAAWTEAEKIVYLILLCENEGKVESRIANAPIPVGRSVVSCKKLLFRLKEKYKVDIENMKNGLPMSTATGTATTTTAGADGEDNATPTKPRSTPRKRKAKVAKGENEGNGEAEGSPKKKAAGGRKKKADAAVKEDVKEDVKEEVKEEQDEDEMMV